MRANGDVIGAAAPHFLPNFSKGRGSCEERATLLKAAEAQNKTDSLIRVAIIEDDRATREGLRLLINGTPNFRCVASHRSVEDAMRSTGRDAHDVLLLDIDLPGMSGSDGVSILKQKYPSAEILMLTVYAEEDKVFESICNGACGYLLKETPPARLLDAIREAHHGGAPMSPEIARKVVTLFQKTGPPEKLDEQLTPQEMRLLRLLVEGYSYQGAADRLKISVNTVRDYIRTIYEKLHVHSKSEAVTKALRSRIIY
jgi:DNA-binding NarL/FixJ family response regulator